MLATERREMVFVKCIVAVMKMSKDEELRVDCLAGEEFGDLMIFGKRSLAMFIYTYLRSFVSTYCRHNDTVDSSLPSNTTCLTSIRSARSTTDEPTPKLRE